MSAIFFLSSKTNQFFNLSGIKKYNVSIQISIFNFFFITVIDIKVEKLILPYKKLSS